MLFGIKTAERNVQRFSSNCALHAISSSVLIGKMRSYKHVFSSEFQINTLCAHYFELCILNIDLSVIVAKT